MAVIISCNALSSFAKHWLPCLPVQEVWMALGRRMDDEFFEFVKAIRFEVKISDVIVFPEERSAICHRWQMTPEEFLSTVSDSYSILGLVFADRSNQYSQALRHGISTIQQAEGRQSALGLLNYVCKRFYKHMYNIECDLGTTDSDESLKHLFMFDMIFMDALDALTADFKKSVGVLPWSL